jgi:hypothetical protein
MLRRLSVLAVLGCAASTAGQTVYTWVDAEGEHYTDDPSAIPPGAHTREAKGGDVSVIKKGATPVVELSQPEEPEAPARAAPKRKAQAGPVTVELSAVKVALEPVDRQFIEAAVASSAASPLLSAWGGLTTSARVEVVSGAELSECAFGQAFGLDLVKLRSPKEVPMRGRALPYEKTMVHELAHLLEHQRASQARPRWFAEGFANVVADFGGYASADDVAWWTIAKGGPHPLATVFPQAPIHLAYALATAAVSALMELVGKDGILKMFELRAHGTSFDAAFSKVAGISVSDFEARFVERQRPLYHERAERLPR